MKGIKKKVERNTPLYQNGEIYDVFDMQVVLLGLKKDGYDLHVSSTDSTRLQITCNKTRNRFLVQYIGHNEWPAKGI